MGLPCSNKANDIISSARFFIHIGGGVSEAFHVDLWYPYVEAVDPSTIVIIRSERLFDLLRRTRPELPLVYVNDGYSAEALLSGCPSAIAILYIANTGNSIHFLRFNQFSHVFLGHGDSEKAASSHKFFRAYDEVWTAGRAHIDRFRASGMNYDGLRFRVVGRPTLRDLLCSEPDPTAFLYLPTWEGFQAEQDYTSIRAAGAFVSDISTLTGRKATVKLHPWTGRRDASLNKVEAQVATPSGNRLAEIEVVERNEIAVDRMKPASFLIADISSVVSDFLPTGRPIFLFIPEDREVRTSSSAIAMDSYCYVFHNSETLHALVRQVIVEGDDRLRDERLRARDYFVDSARTKGQAFEGALRDLIDEHSQTILPWARARAQAPDAAVRAQPKVVGHRGAKRLWPENSLSGFAGAARLSGLDAIELDLHMTKDGGIVVLHDHLLDRTTTGTGPVSTKTMAEIRALKLVAGTKSAPEVLNEGVPTLDEVLEVLRPSGKELHIELKHDALGASYPKIVEQVLAKLKAAELEQRSVLTSFSRQALQDIRALDANIAIQASIDHRSMVEAGGPLRCLKRLSDIPGCALALNEKILGPLLQQYPDLIDPAQVGVWVLNSTDTIRSAISLGVGQITSDRPDVVLKCLNEGITK